MWSPPWLRRDGVDRKRQHRRAVTSFPLMVKGKAWLGIKDPPAGEGQVGQNSTAGRLHPLPFWKGRGLGSGLRTLPLGRNKWGKNYCFSESSARFRLIPSFSEFPSVEARWLLILAHQKAPLTEGGELWLAFLFPYLPHAPFPKPYL